MATHFSIRAARLLVIQKSLSLTSNVDSRINIRIIYRKSTAHLLGPCLFKEGSPCPLPIHMAEVPCFSPFSFDFLELEFGAQVQASDFRFPYLTNNKKGVGKGEL